uniref:Ankyrin repeat domain 52 n=1 Tax=Tetraodon nigroviridis TaxID=99883 RepID=H3BVT9_TETNG
MEPRNIKDQSPLVQAIFSRDTEEVTFLLDHNQDASSLDQEQSTPLHAASYLGDVHIMELIIASGRKLDISHHRHTIFIHQIISLSYGCSLFICIFTGADVNAKGLSLLTPYIEQRVASEVCLEVVNSQEGTPLDHTAKSGHEKMVSLLLSKGANVNANDKKERKPIHWAAYHGHLEVVKLLTSQGANVKCKDKQGYTPLHAAAVSGQLDVIKYLLRVVSEIDDSNAYGNTALHMACYTGQDTVANELVNCGANINRPNRHGSTPLHLAAASSSGVLCLELLVNNGADVTMQNKEGKSPLHVAAMHGRFTGSQILIQNGGEIDCVDIFGNTPLHVAARYGQELLISTLLSNGANKSRRRIDGMLPVHLAALYGFPDCCRKLLSNGQFYMTACVKPTVECDINVLDEYGRTCLHAAASGGNIDCLNLLLNCGADLDIKDHLGRSPLHYAAANKNSQCVVSLVRAGAEVNERDLTGCSPLHCAAASFNSFGLCRTETSDYDEEKEREASLCLDYLLDSGANPTLRNSKGYSAVHYAAAYGNKQHLELLLEISFNCLEEVESNIPVSPLHLAAYYGHCEALRLLCETLVSLDVRDIEGRSALHLAARRGFAPCVEVLLKHQASYTLKEHRHKWTALHAAAAEGQMDCLLLLVNQEHSADIIDCPDTKGQTALMLAALGGHIDCVHILLEKGAKADAADTKGFTALHRAAMLGCEGCVSALLEHGASALYRDSQGRTPLHLAASLGHTELLQTLLKAAMKSDPLDSMLDYRGYMPVHWAAYHGHEDCLCILLEKKLFNYKEGNLFTPLHCALVNGHGVSAGLLLKAVGPDIVNARDAKGSRTPLHSAAYSGKVAGLQLVIDQGAEVNSVDQRGCSALMVAAERGQTRAVEFLLHKAKPDLSLVDISNNTALHLACSKGHEMCALLILGEISDCSLINATNGALQMPLHIAARNGLATVVQVLLSRGAAVMAVDEEGHTPALACAPNKNVAECLALILSTMKPFPPKEASAGTASHFSPLLRNCTIPANC